MSAGRVKKFNNVNAVTAYNLTLQQKAVLIVIGHICNSPFQSIHAAPLNSTRIGKKLRNGGMEIAITALRETLKPLESLKLIERDAYKNGVFGGPHVAYKTTDFGNTIYHKLKNEMEVTSTKKCERLAHQLN